MRDTLKVRPSLLAVKRLSVSAAIGGLVLLGLAPAFAQQATTYDYDALGRLTKTNDRSGWTSEYQLDPASNRTRVKVANQFLRSWQATDLQHQVGREESGGWSAKVTDPEGYMVFGPDVTDVNAGNRVASFRILIDNNVKDNYPAVVIDVNDADGGGQLASRWIGRTEWKTAKSYETFELPFVMPSSSVGHRLQLRVYYLHNAYARVEKVGLR